MDLTAVNRRLRDPGCTMCKLHEDAQYICLLGNGPKRTDVMFIGEAPGNREDESGKPFVGSSGKYLIEKVEPLGFTRENVFICNAVSCRPPQNRTPTKKEIKTCNKWLQAQIDMVRPKYVLLLGAVALKSVSDKKQRRGKPFIKGGIIYLPTFHPSYIQNYNPAKEALFDRDLALFKEIVSTGKIPVEENINLIVVDNRKKFDAMLEALVGSVSIDIETTCLYPWGDPIYKKDKTTGVEKIVDWIKPKINTIGFGTRTTQWVFPISLGSPFSTNDIKRMLKEITRRLRECYLSAQNGKFDFLWLLVHYDLDWYELFDFDTMLAHYILDENDNHDLKYLAQLYYGAPDWDIDEDTKKGKNGLAALAYYQAHDLYYTRKLRFTLGKQLDIEGDVKRVFDKIMMPCARMFTEIEYDGVFIQEKKMDEAETYLRSEVAAAKADMAKWCKDYERINKDDYKKGARFNWGSPQQLGRLLFGKKSKGGFGLPVVEKTKKGAVSTSESVIKRIDHPIAQSILRFRGAKQQLSFFIEGWKPYIFDHYLHPSFKLHGTVTGRLSAEHPNLQQVPRDERIRQLISAPDGWTLVECDLSQIELRIAAELAQEKAMLEAFRTGVDVHWMTVLRELERGHGQVELILDTARTLSQNKKLAYADCFPVLLKAGPDACIEIRKEWKELRKKAKAVNFGYLYGMWWKKFKLYARDNYDVIVTDEQAQDSRENFFDTWSDFPEWYKRQRRYARRHGFVKTLSGRRRRLPAALGEKSFERDEAERQAINCVTTDTEMLTEAGWKNVDQLKIGEGVFSYSMKSGKLHLKPLQYLTRGHSKGKMWKIDHYSVSALSTPNHRWPIENKGVTQFKTSAELTMHGHDKLIIGSRGLIDYKSSWTDDEVRLMGWVLTDGHYKKSNPNRVGVTQSKPQHLLELKALFERLGKHSYVLRPTGQHIWEISCEVARRLRKEMPEKTLTMRVILSMSDRQRRILFECMLNGDGSWGRKVKRYRKLTTGTEVRANAFLQLCAIIGQPARSSSRDMSKYKPISKKLSNIPKMGIVWHVELPVNSYAQPQYRSRWVDWEGEVWCPTTVDGTWIAKRNNKVFITGNSPVQSFANEINLMAAIQFRSEFDRDIARICGTVHDSILFRCKNSHVARATTRLLEIMSRPALFDDFDIELSVPIMGEAKCGPWGASVSLKKWIKENGKRY